MEFCTNCGQPLDPITNTCPVCSGIVPSAPVRSGFTPALKKNLSSGLMLVMCIVLTVYTVFAGLSNTWVSDGGFRIHLELFSLLAAVALWIIYASAHSGYYSMSLGGLKFLSVLITIARVLLWIVFGLLIFVAVILFAAPSLVGADAINFVDSIQGIEILQEMIPNFSYTTLYILIGVVLIIFAIIIAIFNAFFFGCVSRSVKSVIGSVETDQYRLEKFGGVQAWLIVLGCLAAVAIASEIPDILKGSFDLTLVTNIIDIVVMFVGAALAGKVKNTAIIDEQVPYSEY